jgi:Kef-type K+ transport system membrane component KefB
MPETGLDNLLAVALIAFAAPLALGLVPWLRLPAVVLEIVAGIAVGPSGLGWVEVDEAVRILALVGLAFLLFLAGLEIDLAALPRRALRAAALGFALSAALAAAAGAVIAATGLADSAALVAVTLVATSLGVVVPVLKDAGRSSTPFGQAVIAGASIADFGAIIVLSLLFSRDASGTGTRLALLAGFAVTVAVTAFVLAGGRRLGLVSDALVRLQDTTAQIRVRGAFALLVALAAAASSLGLETILGAFMAGVVLRALDRDEQMTHPRFHDKLEATGYGVFIPAFFVTSGLTFDLHALTGSTSALLAVPVFVVALVVVRGLPAITLRAGASRRELLAAGLLHATSLPFIVAATGIGVELGLIGAASAAGLVAAGLVSVLAFPLLAVTLLGERPSDTVPDVKCQEFVELVTEYLDGAMSPGDRIRFQAHIDHCDECREYLAQFRDTIAAVGHLPPESIAPEAEARLLDAFRGWKRDSASPAG